MKKYNYGISILLIAISVAMILTSTGYDEAVHGTAMGPGVWPIILAVTMIVLSIALIIETIVEKAPAAEEEDTAQSAQPIQFGSEGMKRVFWLLLALVVFGVLLKLLGFYIAIVFLIPAVMYILGERSWWMHAAITAGTMLFIVVVFVLVLRISLPQGLLLRF